MVAEFIRRLRPSAGVEGSTDFNKRFTPYGDQYLVQPIPPDHRGLLAEEGSYYTVVNPTPDTTVACGIIAAYVVTTPLFHIANGSANRNITLDYVKLRVTIAPASAVNAIYTIDVDNTLRLSTAPTGGSNRTVNNVNPARSQDFEGAVYAFTGGTVLTVMGGSNVRTIGHGAIAHSIPIAHDELLLTFGQPQSVSSPATAVSRRVGNAPPVVIPPGCSASIHIYFVSNAATGLSAEYEMGLWQR